MRTVLAAGVKPIRDRIATREEQLVAQAGANERARLDAQREAAQIDLVESARLRADCERAEIQSNVTPQVLLALALQELAGQIGQVEHLTITPDLLAPLLQRASGKEA